MRGVEIAPGVFAAVLGKSEQSVIDATLSSDQRLAAERVLLARWSGFTSGHIHMLQQTHSADGHYIDSCHDGIALRQGVGDALWSDRAGELLVVRTADCLPLFFLIENTSAADAKPKPQAIGVIHAGWRGLVAGVVESTLAAALDSVAIDWSRPESTTAAAEWRLRLFAAPAIGGEVYEVGPEVGCHFEIRSPGRGDRCYIDLWRNCRERLGGDQRFGRAVKSGKIDFDERFFGCTYRENYNYFSHRQGDQGRNLNLIYASRPLSRIKD